MKGHTIYELLTGYREKGAAAPVLEGLEQGRFPQKEGLWVASVGEMLDLRVPVQEVSGGRITGFQRDLNIKRARKVAIELKKGQPMPPVQVGLHDGSAWVSDGQTRVAGGVIARVALEVVVHRQSPTEMRRLFAGQQKQTRVNPSTLVLSADDPLSEYVQDAVTNPQHPWADLVTYATSSKVKLTASQARRMLSAYLSNTQDINATHEGEVDLRRADDLARMLRCFGGGRVNPAAYTNTALRSTTSAAIIVIRRNENESRSAIERWERHMPSFDFRTVAHLSVLERTHALIDHWNKHLSRGRRVERGT